MDCKYKTKVNHIEQYGWMVEIIQTVFFFSNKLCWKQMKLNGLITVVLHVLSQGFKLKPKKFDVSCNFCF